MSCETLFAWSACLGWVKGRWTAFSDSFEGARVFLDPASDLFCIDSVSVADALLDWAYGKMLGAGALIAGLIRRAEVFCSCRIFQKGIFPVWLLLFEVESTTRMLAFPGSPAGWADSLCAAVGDKVSSISSSVTLALTNHEWSGRIEIGTRLGVLRMPKSRMSHSLEGEPPPWLRWVLLSHPR